MLPAGSFPRPRLLGALRRDGERSGAADEQRQLQLCQIMWTFRHVVLAAALGAGLADGWLDRPDTLVAIALGLQLANHAITKRWRRVAPVVTVVDAALLVGFAALGLPAGLVLTLGVAVLGWGATFRPFAAAGACAAVLTATALTWRAHPDLHAGTVVGAFVLLALIFTVRAIRLNMGARRATERELLVAERIDAIMWEEDLATPGTLKVSPAAERLLGHPRAAWTSPTFVRELAVPDDRTRFADALAGRVDGAVTVRVRHANGSTRALEVRTNRVSGGTSFLVGVLIDRTEQVEAEREALAFGSLVATSPTGKMLLRCAHDDRGPLLDALNEAGQHVLGVDHDAIGHPLAAFARAGTPIAALLALLPGATRIQTVQLTGADGREYQTTLRHIDDHVCSVDFLDITERVEGERRLWAQARHDQLTDLPNRRAFVEALEERLTAGREPVVVHVDLDDFKDVNDALGPEVGDRLLVNIGRRLASRVGDGELVARLGGDEFAIVLDRPDDDTLAARVQDILELVNTPVVVGDLRLRVRASVGVGWGDVCRIGEPAGSIGEDALELLRRADAAMHHTKARRGGVALYDPAMDRMGRDRLALVGELEQAITDHQLTLHHQPLVDLATDTVIGTEALVRWHHPTRGMLPPDMFIELAEVSGQMKALTRWVIGQALRDLRALGDAGRTLEVSVNLSVQNLYEDDLTDWIASQLIFAGIEPHRLVVEITESTIMDDHDTAVETIRRLAELGVRTWIDDFGTGHSSFARLGRLPVDGVKIDRSFVSGATTSPSDRIMLRSIVDLARALGLQSIAEGVETLDCLELLGEVGCTIAQGYHISRPMPFDALRSWLAALPDHAVRPEVSTAPGSLPAPGSGSVLRR